jgi:hypothetical protein
MGVMVLDTRILLSLLFQLAWWVNIRVILDHKYILNYKRLLRMGAEGKWRLLVMLTSSNCYVSA